MKRKARESRMQERMEKQRASLVDREEIFEVGEAGMSLEELAEAIQVGGWGCWGCCWGVLRCGWRSWRMQCWLVASWGCWEEQGCVRTVPLLCCAVLGAQHAVLHCDCL